MLKQYSHKVKTLSELSEHLSPRVKKVVMCHGVFDIVHPGHIRHLMYAKSKGDLLVASLTCDHHISKGEFRPYVPQELRALNLAALEVVDFVLIDNNPTPIENILRLKPDIFVKGFEYTRDQVPPKTQEEMDAVASYGGDFAFSPGDVVYSSTALLALHRPNLKLDKLMALMMAEGVSFSDLAATVRNLGGRRVHVVGDTIVDRYTYCSVLGPTTKTPTIAVKKERSELFIGGAGIVARHFRSLGADVTFSTVLGEDALGTIVADNLQSAGVRFLPVVDPTRVTTEKERFWADNYKLLQVDSVDNSVIPDASVDKIAADISGSDAEIVVLSDFRHGIFNPTTVTRFKEAIRPGVLKVADSQVSNRWGNILDFSGFDVITPNEREARFALGDQDSGVQSLGQNLYDAANVQYLVLKLGERGALVYRSPRESPRTLFFLDSVADEVVDAVGAGDALLAAATLTLASTKSIFQAAVIGSVAAAVCAGCVGNVPVSQDDLLKRIAGLKRAAGATPSE